MFPVAFRHGAFMGLAYVFGSGNQKPRSAAGRVADCVAWLWLYKFHHHFPYMLGGAELSVLSRRGKLAEHIFVNVALHVQSREVVFKQIFQTADYFCRTWGVGIKNMASFMKREKAVSCPLFWKDCRIISPCSPISGRMLFCIFLTAGKTRLAMML